MRVPTFGNLRIEAYLQLPAAYRSLSRPSSALDAKAFTICSFSLERSFVLLFALSFANNCLDCFEQMICPHLFFYHPFIILSDESFVAQL